MPKATALASVKSEIQRRICLAPDFMYLANHPPTLLRTSMKGVLGSLSC